MKLSYAIVLLALATRAVASETPPVPHSVVASTRWLIGAQARIEPSVYKGKASYEARLDAVVDAALADPRLRPGDAAIVVLPEYFGTWLVLADEKAGVYAARSKTQAMLALLEGDLKFAEYLAKQSLRSRRSPLDPNFFFATLLHFKAARMWAIYKSAAEAVVAKARAAGHDIVLVEGSIVLPELDRLDDPDAPLYNTSGVFAPDGTLLQLTGKAYPTRAELPFTAKAPLESLAPVDTPLGRLGNMICADGWYPDVYARLREAQVLAQPSFGEGDLSGFSKPWQGYDGAAAPDDVDPRDARQPGGLTERGAWRKYSLAARIRSTGARYGVNPFLSGRMWDLPAGGYGVGVDLSREGRELEEVATDPDRDTFIYVPLGG